MKKDEDAGDVPFREVVGSLMWIANQTRPDISNAVRWWRDTLTTVSYTHLGAHETKANLV